jgi:DNA-binding LacI/PurR family transcriptional regulator
LPIVVDVRNDRARFRRFLKRLLERQVEGLIVMGNAIYPEGDLLKTMEQCRVPVVMIGREFKRKLVSSVTGDNERGAAAMMEHLHGLGHRRIAYIRGPRVFIDSAQRWKGIESFARESGLTLDPKLVVELNLRNAGHQGGYELAQGLIRQGIKFTALMAHDDLTAFGAIRALLENGRRVPEDCSVAGFDDVSTAAYYNPPLTTIHQDMEEQGRIGVEVLLDILKTPNRDLHAAPSHRRVVPRLVVRGSTMPPRK